MATAIYDVSIAWDTVTRRGIPGQVAKVTDATTDIPVDEVLDLDGNPLAALVSDSQGYVQGFQVEDGPALVKLNVGSVTYTLLDQSRIEAATNAAMDAAQAAQQAAELVEAPADEVVAMLAGNPSSLTHSAVDTATGGLIGTDGSAVQVAADGRYVNKTHIDLNVLDFGADRTGTVDSTSAINACFAQVAGAGTVLFPPGTYLISDTITPKSGTTITGYGAQVKRTANVYMMIPGGTSQNPTFYSGTYLFSCFGLGFHGNALAGFGKALVPMGHCKDVVFRDAPFIDIGEHGLDISGCDTVDLYKCAFKGQIAGASPAEAVQVDIASAPNFPHHGAWDYTVCRNISVRNCYFGPNPDSGLPAPNRGVGSHASVQGVPFQNIRVEACEFYDIQETAVVARNWEGVVERCIIRGAKGIYITPSVIGDPDATGTTSTTSSTTQKFEIRANDILVAGHGIEVFGRVGGELRNVSIDGNTIGCTTTALDGTIHGIYLRGYRAATVRGNIVRDFPGNGIYSVPPTDVPCRILIVDANTIIHAGTNGIYINATDLAKVSGNTTSGIGWVSADPAHVRALGANTDLTICGHTVDPTGDMNSARGMQVSSSASRVTRYGNNWGGLTVTDNSPTPVVSGERA